MSVFTITVPATSANNGPGFDSTGVAVNRYLTLQVEKQDTWEFEHRSSYLGASPHYEKHYIYHIAKQIAEKYHVELPACKIIVNSDIPLARGLGSSASAVVAGIELVNQLCNLSLTCKDKLLCATEIEGHPDNVAPALIGGLVVSAQFTSEEIEYIKLPALDLDTVLYIPNVELKTSEARKVLPETFSRNEATAASGISNLMLTALMAKDYELAGQMMERDLFHEPYRAKLIPNYEKIKEEARKRGAYGTVISGAGPTMISFVPKNAGEKLVTEMQKMLPDYEVVASRIDYQGLQVTIEK